MDYVICSYFVVIHIRTHMIYIVVQVHLYDRLSPLVPLKTPLRSFSDIRTGDCIVTFSRHKIYKLKVRPNS